MHIVLGSPGGFSDLHCRLWSRKSRKLALLTLKQIIGFHSGRAFLVLLYFLGFISYFTSFDFYVFKGLQILFENCLFLLAMFNNFVFFFSLFSTGIFHSLKEADLGGSKPCTWLFSLNIDLLQSLLNTLPERGWDATMALRFHLRNR